MQLKLWQTIALTITVVSLAIILDEGNEVQATTQCHSPAGTNWCQGFAHTATGGATGARCFALRVTNTAPTCSTSTGNGASNEATWQMDAGQCITLRYFDGTAGAVPPSVPNKVTIQWRFDNTATVINTLLSAGAEPTNGATFSFCATSTGLAGGAARAGTYQVYLNAVKDNSAGGVGNYNVDSIGTAGFAFDKGAIRAAMIVSSVDRSAYPAGSMFAYGASGDETATITGTFSTPNGDANVELMLTAIIDAATGTIGQAGASVDVDSGTLAQGYVIDNTFPFANNPYVAVLSNQGNSVMTGLRWTIMAASGHGANIVRDSDSTVHNSVSFTIDSRIRIDSDGTGGFATADQTALCKLGSSAGAVITAYNRGEGVYCEWYIYNARDELLSRSMNAGRYDSFSVQCVNHGTLTPTANKYSETDTIGTAGGSCSYPNTDPGNARHLRITNTDQDYSSGTTVTVGTVYYLTAHTQIAASPRGAEDTTFTIRDDGMGGDDSDTIHLFCRVQGVRLNDVDTSGSAVTGTIRDPTTTVRVTANTDTAGDGWTPTSLNYLASTPLGTWTGTCAATYNGNTGTDTQNFVVVVEGGGGTIVNEVLHVGDPLKVFAEYYEHNNSVLITISESYLDGTARTGNAAGTDIYLYAPDGSLVVNGDQPTEVQYGTYRYEYGPATDGNWLVLIRTLNETGVSIGTSNVFTVNTMHDEPSLYILMLLIALGLAVLGEMRRDNVYRAFAGFILIVASFVAYWEMQRLGFNNVLHGYGLGFLIPFMLLQIAIGAYMLYPKNWKEEGES